MTTYDSAGVSQKLGDDASKVLYGAPGVTAVNFPPFAPGTSDSAARVGRYPHRERAELHGPLRG